MSKKGCDRCRSDEKLYLLPFVYGLMPEFEVCFECCLVFQRQIRDFLDVFLNSHRKKEGEK